MEATERARDRKIPKKHEFEHRFDAQMSELTRKHERAEKVYANEVSRVGEFQGRLKYLQYCRRKLNQGRRLCVVQGDGIFWSWLWAGRRYPEGGKRLYFFPQNKLYVLVESCPRPLKTPPRS